jgi:hypothetical protein
MLMFNNLEYSFLQEGIFYAQVLHLEEMQIISCAKLLPTEIERNRMDCVNIIIK